MQNYPEPEAVFRYFAQICDIPHGSGHTEKIRAWLLQTAASLGIPAEADSAGNVILRKPASAGYESHPGVILQGHMDMVCAKLPDCTKNMETDGLDLIWTEEFLSANGTTLGGDDGIAVAYILAIFADSTLRHPPLTAIITVDEETGMDGANALSPGALDGASLINIDSEEEGVFTVGCAGGVRVHMHYPACRREQTGCSVRLSVSGLTGGHSGAEIHKPLLNANTVLLRLMQAAGVPFALVALAGGVRDNVIPTEAFAELLVQPDDIPALRQNITQEQEKIQAEYPNETGFAVSVQAGENTAVPAVSPEDTAVLLRELSGLPNGVQSMLPALAMPQTSLNLGIFAMTDSEVTVDALLRSASNAEKYALAQKLENMVKAAGGTAERSGDYPAWEYAPGSPLETTASSVFESLYHRKPRIEVIHAGLECGILAAKKPGLACISIGPDLFDIHTPRERLSVPSAARTYGFITALLAAL